VTDDLCLRLEAEIALIEAFGWKHDTRLLTEALERIRQLESQLQETTP
jgi:hypothetical protein